MERVKSSIDRQRIALFLKIGIIGAIVIQAGDMLIGWGVKDTSLPGLEGQLSQYLTVPDRRMFWASVCGFTGVPLAVVGHYGIYKLLKPYSQKYARMYAVGILGFLAFGGAGVHVSSVEAAFFYRYVTAAGLDTAFASTVKFAAYFAGAGLTALALAYWNQPGLPSEVAHIPLETIEKPVERLRKLGVQKVCMWGISKGAELALLCGSYFPELISAVGAVSPASHVIQGFQMTNCHHLMTKPLEASPFTYQGNPLPYVKTEESAKRSLMESIKRRGIYFRPGYEHVYDGPPEETAIPVERCSGPVLLLAAEQDDMWDSCRACENILRRLKGHDFPYPVQYEQYPYGSHMLFPIRIVLNRLFITKRKYKTEFQQSCRDSFEKTMEFIKNC